MQKISGQKITTDVLRPLPIYYSQKLSSLIQKIKEFVSFLFSKISSCLPFTSLDRKKITNPKETPLFNSQDLVEVGKKWLELESDVPNPAYSKEMINQIHKRVSELFLEEKTLDAFVKATPIGIQNIGNSCYLNSCCQVLFSSKPLMKQLFKNTPQAQNVNGCLLKTALQKFAIQTYIAQKEGISSINVPFTSQIRDILFTENFFPFEDIDQQQCAGECLSFLLNSFEFEKLKISTTRSVGNERSFPKNEKETLLITPIDIENGSFFSRLFSNPISKLEAFIESFCNNEQNQPWRNHNKYKEEKRILNTPEVLIIQCKRTGKNGKLSKEIDAPETLDISPFMNKEKCGKNSFVKYRLKSHITHHGLSSDGGHYTAHISKNSDKSRINWYQASDNEIIDCSEQELEERKNAVIYVYERI